MTVKILNPLPGGASHIGEKRAARHVRRGIADWVGDNSIRFREAHHRRRAAESNSGQQLEKKIAEFKRTAGDYDKASHGGIASSEQLAGIPIVKPRELTAPKGRLNPRPMFMRAADVNGTNRAHA